MAEYARRQQHVIIADSRINGVYELIKEKKKPGHCFQVYKYNGATFTELAEKADTHAQNYPFDIIYIVGV